MHRLHAFILWDCISSLTTKSSQKIPSYIHTQACNTHHTHLCDVFMSTCVYVYACVHVCMHTQYVCTCLCSYVGDLRKVLHALLYHCPPCFFDAGSPTDPGTFSPSVFLSLPHSVLGFNTCQTVPRIFMWVLGVHIPVLVLAEQAFLATKIPLKPPHIVFKK